MADSNLTISISADSAKLRAELAVAQSSMRAFQAEMNRAASAARKAGDDMSFAKVAQSAAQFEAARGTVAKLSQELEHVSAGFKGVSLASAGATRELIVLGHEMLQGRYSRFGGSMMVLAERMGGLHEAVSAMLGPIGALSALAVGVAAPLAYMAYQAYETQNSLKGLNAELLLTGRGNGGGFNDLGKAATELAAKYNLSQRAAAELLSEISKAHPLSLQQIKDLADIAAAEAKVRGEDPSEVGKRMAERLNEGAKGAIALAQGYNIATTAAEQMLKAGDAAGALKRVLDDLKQHIESHGGAWAAAKAKFEQYISALGYLAGGVDPYAASLQLGGPPPEPTPRPSAGSGTADSARMRDWLSAHGYSANATAAVMGNASVESGFDPNAVGPGGHRGLFQWDKSRWASGGSPAGDFEKQMALMDAELTKLDATFKVSGASVEELTKRFEAGFERSGGQMLDKRVAAAQGFAGGAEPYGAREARERAMQAAGEQLRLADIEYRHSLEGQIAAATDHYEQIKKLAGEGTAEEAHAKQELIQKLAQLYDQDVQNKIAALKAQQAATQDHAEKIRLQEQVIATIQSAGAMRPSATSPGGGGVNQQELNAARTELEGLRRQAGQQSFQLGEQGVAAQRHANADILRGYEAQEEAAVKLRQLNPFTALNNELAMARELANENAAKLGELMSNATSVAERTRVYWQIWDEGVRAQTEALELTKRRAEEVKAVMDKWTAPIKSAVDSVGSSFESAVSGLLTRQKTWAQAMSDIGRSATSGIMSAVGSVLSKIGGGLLGGKPGEGVGDVIANKVIGFIGNQLGSSILNVGGEAAQTAAITTAIAGQTAALTAAIAASTTAITSAVTTGAIVEAATPKPFGFYRGGVVPSAAGGWVVPRQAGAVPANLHGGEMVLPAHLSSAVQDMANRGGSGDVHINIAPGGNVFGAEGFKKFLRDEGGDAIRDAVRSGFRSNKLTPRSL